MDKNNLNNLNARQAIAIACWLSTAAVAGPSAAAATSDSAMLDEVVVVATKRESLVRDIAADVSVISDEDLDATLAVSLADTFRFTPGVSHEGAGSRFGSEGVTIRGIGGNRVALEVDGVPVSQHFAIGNFSNATRDFIDPALIGRIEILRGPASAMYGSSALGGVVAARTPQAQRLVSSGTSGGDAGVVFHDMDDSVHLSGRAAFLTDPMSVLVAGSVRDGDGMESKADPATPDERGYRRRAGLVKFAGENRLGHTWQLSALSQTDDVSSNIRSILGQGRFASTTRLEGDDRMAFELVSAEYGFGDSADWFDEAVLRVFYAGADIVQHTVDERAAARTPVLLNREFSYDQDLRGAEVNLWRATDFAGWSNSLGLGLEWTERRTAEFRDGSSTNLQDGSVTSTILGEEFPLRDFPVTVTREIGAWLSDQVQRGPMTLMMAVRFDDNRLTPQPDAMYLEDNPATETVSVSASDFSPKLGIVYRLGANTDLYLQYAKGFRAPPFEDANIGLDIPLFNIRAIPNPDLRSETSVGWESGVRWHGARAGLQLGLFNTDYEDFIETKARIGVDAESGRLLFQSRNIDEARIRGVETRASVDLAGALEGVTLHAAAYWAEGENRANGDPLATVGPPEAVLGATWQSADGRTEVRTLVTAVGDWSQGDGAAAQLFEPAGYGVADIYLTRLVGEHLTLRAGVGNLTDRLYWRWSDVRGLAVDDPVLPVLAQPGRHYSIGLQWDW